MGDRPIRGWPHLIISILNTEDVVKVRNQFQRVLIHWMSLNNILRRHQTLSFLPGHIFQTIMKKIMSDMNLRMDSKDNMISNISIVGISIRHHFKIFNEIVSRPFVSGNLNRFQIYMRWKKRKRINIYSPNNWFIMVHPLIFFGGFIYTSNIMKTYMVHYHLQQTSFGLELPLSTTRFTTCWLTSKGSTFSIHYVHYPSKGRRIINISYIYHICGHISYVGYI